MKSNEFSVGGERVIIEDADIVKAIAYLKRNGCSVIIRDEETIQFQMWANLDSGRDCLFDKWREACNRVSYQVRAIIGK